MKTFALIAACLVGTSGATECAYAGPAQTKRLGAHSEGHRLVRRAVVQRAVRRMQVDRGPRVGLEPRDAEHVVDVRVGEPDPDGPHAFGLQLVGDHSRFLPGIDDRALSRRFVDNEVAVLDELAVRNLNDAHG